MPTRSELAAATVNPIRRDLRLLLRVIQGARDDTDVWARWRAEYRLDDPVHGIDIQAMKLLPAALDRVRALGVIDREMQQLEGIERYFWAWSEANVHEASVACELLQSEGVNMVAMKGLAMRAYGLTPSRHRPMSDVDLVVRQYDMANASETLTRAGFALRSETQVARIFTKDRVEIDLHAGSTVLQDPRFRVFDWLEEYHRGLPYRVIGKTGCLITTILHGLSLGGGAIWVLDVEALARSGEVDWPAVVKYAKERALVLTFATALVQVPSAPAAIVEELERAPASYIEALELRHMTVPGDPYGGGAARRMRALRAEVAIVSPRDLEELERTTEPKWDSRWVTEWTKGHEHG